MSQMIFGGRSGNVCAMRRAEIRRPISPATQHSAQAVFRLATRMKTKLLLATALASVVGLFAAGAASGAFVAIYRNAMETTTQRAELRKLSGKSCTRGGGKTSLQVTVGKLTEFCAYKTPVVGSDLEIAVTGRISASTPP